MKDSEGSVINPMIEDEVRSISDYNSERGIVNAVGSVSMSLPVGLAFWIATGSDAISLSAAAATAFAASYVINRSFPVQAPKRDVSP